MKRLQNAITAQNKGVLYTRTHVIFGKPNCRPERLAEGGNMV